MKSFRALLLISLLFCMTAPLLAQDTAAPALIQVFREEVKPGRGPAHSKLEASWAQTVAKGNSPQRYVALTTLTGPTEAWFISGYASMEAWEKDNKAAESNTALGTQLDQLSHQETDILSGTRSFVARYREDLSHRPGVNMAKMRYISVTIVRTRPGHAEDYEEVRKMIKSAHEKAKVGDNHSVYQVTSGMANGTFLVLTPLKSLADADASAALHGPDYQNAIGDDGRRRMRDVANSGINSSDTMILAFDPKMSYPTKEWQTADPEYWGPKTVAKPMAKPAAATKKEADKPKS
ncbi:MAG: hypothetical protein HY046_02395 [Acidobacteria bacterium]|nr:hypothetical protein [Acidobacteriota bacterium]